MSKQRNILILIGILSLFYVLIFLLSPKDITDYTIVDTEYWRTTNNRLMIKTAYEYNNNEDIKSFPKNLSDWKGFDYRYSNRTYEILNADILLSRLYAKNGTFVWFDIINSKTGESFHKQKICVEGAGWTIDKESIQEFRIADYPNPYIKLYANRLDISRKDDRQIMIYWFMFKKFGAKDAVTMIRISANANNNEEESFKPIKEFVESELFKTMYKNTKLDITTAEYILSEYGNKGIFVIITMLTIPIGIFIIGIRKK